MKRWILIVSVFAPSVLFADTSCPPTSKATGEFVCIKAYETQVCTGQIPFVGARYDVNAHRVICVYDQGDNITTQAGLLEIKHHKPLQIDKWEKFTDYSFRCANPNPLSCLLIEGQ